jgi:bifunctional polynucleotide phosphatase/kinase
MNWEGRSVHPRVPFWNLVKSFEPPQEAEGFDRVFKIGFRVSSWDSKCRESVLIE